MSIKPHPQGDPPRNRSMFPVVGTFGLIVGGGILVFFAPVIIFVLVWQLDSITVRDLGKYSNFEFAGENGEIYSISPIGPNGGGLWIETSEYGRVALNALPPEVLAKFHRRELDDGTSILHDDTYGIRIYVKGETYQDSELFGHLSIAREENGEYLDLPCSMKDLRRVFGEPETYKREWDTRPGMAGH